MTDLSTLPPLERMEAYRALAQKALKASEGLYTKEAREHFLFIAAQWAGLAQDIELRLRRTDEPS